MPAISADRGAGPTAASLRRASAPDAAAAAAPRAAAVGALAADSESTRVAARPAALALAGGGDQRPGARVALGRVLGDGALDHRVEPLRHLRLGVGFLAGEGRRSRSAPRRGRSRASRRRRPARPRSPRHCSGDMYSAVPTTEAPLRDAALAERLGEAEVGEVGAVAFDQDVVRLDVAVDDAGGVGGVERFGDLAEQGDRARPAAAAPRGRSALRRSPPSTSRIATISSPSTSRESKTGTTAGWSRRAARRDSRRKRSRKPSRSASSRAITFSATGRSRPRWVAR